jgi:hypothetical protein
VDFIVMDEPTNVLARAEVQMRDKGYGVTMASTETTRIFRPPSGCLGGLISTPPGASFTAAREGPGRTRLSVRGGSRGVERLCEQVVVRELGGTRAD